MQHPSRKLPKIIVTLHIEQKQELIDRANEEQRTVSVIVRRALEAELSKDPAA